MGWPNRELSRPLLALTTFSRTAKAEETLGKVVALVHGRH